MAAFSDASLGKLNDLFKTSYADKLERLYNEDISIFMSKMSIKEHTGKDFQAAVALTREGGATFAASGSGAYSLNPGVNAVDKIITVDGSNFSLQSHLGYEDAKKAQLGKLSFVNAMEYKVKNLTDSASYFMEAQGFYGQSIQGLGQVGSVTFVSMAVDVTVAFKTGQWATGLWAGAVGLKFDIFPGTAVSRSGTVASGGITGTAGSRTARNSTGEFIVKSVDVAAKTVIFTAATTAIAGAVAANDVIKFYGADGNEFIGVDAVMENKSTLYGINTALYSLFQPNRYNVGGNLSLAKIGKAVGPAIGKGLMNEKLMAYVNNEAVEDVNSDLAAKREFDYSYKPEKGEEGNHNISYNLQGNSVEIVPHTMVKEGDGYLLPDEWEKVGASDLTFDIPLSGKGEFFHVIPGYAGVTFECWAHLGLLTRKPAKSTKLFGITISA